MSAATQIPAQTASVLIVDDDASMRDVLARVVARCGHPSLCAADGLEALQLLKAHSVSLVITDMSMPRLSGFDLLQMLRAESPNLPVVLISGVADSTDVLAAFELGVSRFVRKPFRARDMIQVVQTVLAGGVLPAPIQAGAASPPAPVAVAPVVTAPQPRAPAAIPAPAPIPAPAAIPAPVQRFRTPVREIVRKTMAELASGKVEMPPADPMMLKLHNLQLNPGLGADDVHAIVQQSLTLSAKMLGIANSAYYAGARPVSNLKDALRRLGNRRVLSVAQTVVHQKFYTATTPALTDLLTASWKQTMFVATLSRELARGRVQLHAEDVYLAAMMHNIGEVLLVKLVAGAWGEKGLTEEDLQALSDGAAAHHESLGHALLKSWRLPDLCVRLAAAHQKLSGSVRGQSEQQKKLAHIVSLSAHASARTYIRCAITDLPDISPPESMQLLGIDKPALAQGIVQARQFCGALIG
jgi:HD-like signal output (HDOD) protein/CheY-like chemotaxis protein